MRWSRKRNCAKEHKAKYQSTATARRMCGTSISAANGLQIRQSTTMRSKDNKSTRRLKSLFRRTKRCKRERKQSNKKKTSAAASLHRNIKTAYPSILRQSFLCRQDLHWDKSKAVETQCWFRMSSHCHVWVVKTRLNRSANRVAWKTLASKMKSREPASCVAAPLTTFARLPRELLTSKR